MFLRFAWLLGLVVLVSIAVLVACGTTYNSASDGLVLLGSQGSALIQTFSFRLNNGQIAGIYNTTTNTGSEVCVLPGLPSSMVLDPNGQYAYAILTSTDGCTNSKTGIQGFKVNSDGTVQAVGSVTADPNPVALFMDGSGKFLFVAEGIDSRINVYSVNAGTVTLASSSPVLPPTVLKPNLVALAATPTVFPGVVNGVQQAVCSLSPAPTAQYLYVIDQANYLVWQFGVDMKTGALGYPPGATTIPSYSASPVPAGVAVDPCDRFVYVSGSQNNNVNAYTICTAVSIPQGCAIADGSLVTVSGSPFSLSGGANGPGPIAVDPFGNYVYVVDTLSNQISTLRISSVSGSLTAANPAVVATGLQPTSLAIRADDNWLFVANFGAATLSQYSITPSTGALLALPVTQTDNYPWGVAVK